MKESMDHTSRTLYRVERTKPSNHDARHQPMGPFQPGVVASGYHVDLRGVAGSYGYPDEADAWVQLLARRRESVLPVTVLQLGLGAWQRSIDPDDPDRGEWGSIARYVADWALIDMDGYGRLAHLTPMPHTYAIEAPWYSAMAQALAVSLFVRTGDADGAQRAAQALLDPKLGLITQTEAGPILEEYPATPRPHVLNGWIWGLFGLYDLSHATCFADSDSAPRVAGEAYVEGAACLSAQLGQYETGRGWSTYDRYPHPVANVASPFYHRLHIDMLRALDRIAPEGAFAQTAARWEQALRRPSTRSLAVARKVGFRLIRPRGRAA